MSAPELVLLGGPNSGKTHYAGQLYGRLRRLPGLLRLREDRGTPPDLSALQEVLNCLEDGHAADHTSAETFSEVLLPLTDQQGRAIDLRWPDYGGEQLSSVFHQRAVTEPWRLRLAKADGWVLLIRLKGEISYSDALEQLARHSSNGNGSQARAQEWDANARWVELLQLLLHVAGVGGVGRVRKPQLAVLLSCYDELDKGEEPPREALARTLPLLWSYIQSTWAPEAMSVWGLSALGRPLESDSSDEAFIGQGPEYQGWIVDPGGGACDPDLSRPLAWLLGAR